MPDKDWESGGEPRPLAQLLVGLSSYIMSGGPIEEIDFIILMELKDSIQNELDKRQGTIH
jgi:hypothetical protein